MRRVLSLVAVALIALVAVPACTGKYESDFRIVIVNRLTNAIQVHANAETLGQVAPGAQTSFTMRLTETNTNTFTDGVAPTPQSAVTLTARDVVTGAVSSAKPVALAKDTPAYVTFTAADFPGPSTPTVARFTLSPTSPGVNQDVQFNASASTPAGSTFNWTFGDGGTGTGAVVSRRYAQAGTYIVTLTVTSPSGQTSTATATVNVTTTIPGANVSFTFSPAAPAVNQDIFFNASTTTISGATFAWDFGDGSTATGVTTTKRYPRAGTYTITLRATNNVGQSAATSRSVTVSATSSQVTASFTFSPSSPAISQPVFFNASTSRPENGTYSWNFGDGSTGTGVTPVHDYDVAGTYTVTLTVSNEFGQSAVATRTITVSSTSASVVASFVSSPSAPAVNQEVLFDASASRPVDGTFVWHFGDGANGSGITARHRYTAPGTYTVVLVVTNQFGQNATTTRTVTVSSTSTQVSASFVFSPTTPGINQDVFFDATASRPTNGTYSWNFGDGTTGTGVTPTKRYTAAGTYTVVLVVANEFGQTASTSRTMTVSSTSGAVTASFVFSPATPGVNQEVFFDATASRPTNATFTWNFGDGSTATGATPTHRYTAAGTYSVTLTVSSEGRLASTSRSVPVSASGSLTADFTFSPTDPTISRGTNVVIFDATPSSAGVTAWTWDFGDGTPVETGQQRVNHTFTRVGTWVVRLTVSNASGQTATTTKNVTVAQ